MIQLRVFARFRSLESLAKKTDTWSQSIGHTRRVKRQAISIDNIVELLVAQCRVDNGSIVDVDYYCESPIDGGMEISIVILANGDALVCLDKKADIDVMIIKEGE